ncbi:YncE family protein [Dyella sp. C11]|uniref:YncE family protein n=1 Tax=Dyella sp. C11 TaxID=2126991 RepID=UPI000D6444EA|nr:YncE family protein [Dyella sp. C11]
MQRFLCAALMGALFVPCASAGTSAAPADQFRVLSRLSLDGAGGWDYLSFDAQRRHLFVTRGDRVDVVDVDQNKRIGTIPGMKGVHGVALDMAAHRGYASNGTSASVTVFDLDSLAVVTTIAGTGEKPDAIVYDPASKHVFTFNGKGQSFSVIDPASNTVTATVPLPGKPEFAVSDEAGHLYVNLEDRAALVKIDSASNTVMATWSLATCEAPTGLAIDRKLHRLFSVCDNKRMAVTNADTGKAVMQVVIGEGPDAIVFDEATATVYSSNGESGNITAVHQDDADRYRVVATIPTQPSARTLALDPARHRLYLSAATLVPSASGGRPTAAPGSFGVLTVGAP